MQDTNFWMLPFGQPAQLELQTDWGHLVLMPVQPGEMPRLELSNGSVERMAVRVDKQDETVRVALEPRHSGGWFGHWECRATLYVPRDVRAHIQTNAGSVSVRDLDDCELGIKANAGKIDLVNVHGLMHLAADAGSVQGREVSGFFDVETHAGSVRLEISDLQPGEHRFRASMGSVRLRLARGLDVSIDSRTSLGSVRNRYPSNPAAAARLTLSTEMGSIRVDEGGMDRSGRRATWGGSPPAADRATAAGRAAAPQAARPEDPELDRILKMVEAGNLSAHEADELLRAMGRV